MAEYYFCKLEQMQEDTPFLNGVKTFANTQKKQVYVISAPLTDKKYRYNFHGAYILLVPKKKITFIYREGSKQEFENYVEDVLDDIASISDKYQFKEILGRRRQWNHLVKIINEEPNDDIFEFLYSGQLSVRKEDHRSLDILISLFIGSINDAQRISSDIPDSILDKVKKKIQLFDSDQTRFIYDDIDPNQKLVRIQGLSGTGKTELLLHKLKDLYVTDLESKICLTCHNKVLADSLSKRIPQFFDFMKVEKQIEWNSRLWCNNAWGRAGDCNSGAFRFICDFYNIPFMSLRSAGSFKAACEYALNKINEQFEISGVPQYAFTYMFVDESQDFDDTFFQLCEIVTEKRVYIAGDIFQSIFETRVAENIKSDYLLSRCYRTDPKTLMFAQGLGMGLFEEDKLWWLEEDMWKMCGYNVNVLNNGAIYELSREPIRRFEDVSADFNSLKIIETPRLYKDILNLISKLKEEFSNVEASDIAIIFIDNDNYVYDAAPVIGEELKRRYGWEYNIAHESKEEKKNSVFLSNRNNVKGLEFPFVFCVTKKIVRDYNYRNALYTMVSRSFLRTYLVVNDSDDNGLTEPIKLGAQNIMNDKKMSVMVPSDEEKQDILHAFKIASKYKSLRERIEDIMKELNIPMSKYETFLSMVEMLGGGNKSDEMLKNLIINANNVMN